MEICNSILSYYDFSEEVDTISLSYEERFMRRKKLVSDKGALGVFGYSFLDQNRDKVKAAKVDGVFPEFEAISSGKYPVALTQAP